MSGTLLHGKDTIFLLGKYQLENYLQSIEPSAELDLADVSVMGNAFKESIPGQNHGSLKAEGFADYTTGMSHDAIATYRGLATDVPASVLLPGTALGDNAVMINGTVLTHGQGGDLSSAMKLEFEVEGNDGLDFGLLYHVMGARTATGNGTSIDGAAATSNGGAASLHCKTVTGTTPNMVVKVQDSADNSSFADIITFTALTAAGYEHKVITGAVRRYVRVIWTITGTTPSFTFAVVFARR